MKTAIIIKNKIVFLFTKYFPKYKKYQITRGRTLYDNWTKEFVPIEDEMFLLNKFISSNDIAFDIGANIGEFSYCLSTIIKNGQVYSFEPQRRVFNILQGSLGNIQNIHLHNISLSNNDGYSTIYVPIVKGRLSPTEASLDLHFNDLSGYEKIKKSEGHIKERIKTSTLDSFCLNYNIKKIDFIKCDTEGHELEILQGSIMCLSQFRPLLLIEIFPYVYEGHFENVLSFLSKYNYVGYVISKTKNNVCQLNRETLRNSKGFNYFFVPQEKELQFISSF